MKLAWSRFQKHLRHPSVYLSERVSGASLSVFRVLFGIFIFLDALFFWRAREGYFPEQEIHFKYPGFESWPNLTPFSLILCLGGLALAGILIGIGWGTRWALATAVCVLIHLLMQNAGFFLNHLVLTLLVAFVLLWVPTTRYYAFQKTLSPLRDRSIARYELLWVLGLFLMTYWLGGFEKLRKEWFSGAILLVNFGLSAANGNWLGNLMYDSDRLYYAPWGTLLIEFLAPLGFLLKRTRIAALVVLLCFHLFNHFALNIGLFSFLMLASFVLYFDPAWPIERIEQFKALKKKIFRGTSLRSS